ncbi:MAG: hypothetical protein WEA09_03795 [Gemmatimonadota bacterium]
MIGFLRKLFDRSAPSQGQDPRKEYATTLERMGQVAPGSPEEARILNRAGDLALATGDREQALRYYGTSIDAHMALRQFDAATAICRKVLRLVPDVVRARCTLAWLCLGKGLLEMAREHLDDYVAAARKAGREEMAAQQVRLMAQYARDDGFREYLAHLLRLLGDKQGAETLSAWAASLPSPEEIGWDPVVFAALLTPDELREAEAQGLNLKDHRRPDDDFPYYFPPTE